MPTVSVVTPCYNAEAFVAETIDSVLAQTASNVELIVVDDRSTDGSWEVIRSYGDRITAKRLERNGGASFARNRGAELASGRYLMFLDADDLIAPDTVASLVATLERRKGLDVVAACRWKELKRRDGTWRPVDPPFPLLPEAGDYLENWLTGWYFPPCAVLWPRELHERVGGWDEERCPGDDAELMMRALLEGVDIALADGGEAYYRVYEQLDISLSRDTSEAGMTAWMRVFEKVTARAEARRVLERYREPIGIGYHRLARNPRYEHPELTMECLRRAERYAGTRTLLSGSRTNRAVQRLLGIARKERIAARLERVGFATRDRRKARRARRNLKQGAAG